MSELPHAQGIYCIYKCTANSVLRGPIPFLDLKGPYYIGQAEDLRNQLASHEKVEECRKELGAGEVLYFVWASVSDVDNPNVAEAALIRHFRPSHNENFKDNFPFPDTCVTVMGPGGVAKKTFNVESTEQTPERP